MKAKLSKLFPCGRETMVASAGLFCALVLLASPPSVLAVVLSASPIADARETGAAPSASVAVRFSPGVDAVVKMLDAGVNQGVIKTYIESAPVLYQPTADEIIALHQRGVPSDLVAAMLRRGGELRAQTATALAAQPAPMADAAASGISDSYPTQTVDPIYAYDYSYPTFVSYYPYSSYGYWGSWGWPYYGYRYGWPYYHCGTGRAWNNRYHYCAPVHSGTPHHIAPHSSVPQRAAPSYAAPHHAPVQYAASHFSVAPHYSGAAHVGPAASHPSAAPPSAGRGGGPSHRGR